MWKRSDLYLRKISAVIWNIRASRIHLKRTVNTDLRYCLRGERGMLLSHRTSVKIRPEYSNIIGHMCYAASKLWNICNYERHHYKELGLEKYPDWYYQKKHIKEIYGINSFRHRQHRRPASSCGSIPRKTENATLLLSMRWKSRNSFPRMDIIYLLILDFII